MTATDLAERLRAAGLTVKDDELPRVLATAQYLRGAVARVMAALKEG